MESGIAQIKSCNENVSNTELLDIFFMDNTLNSFLIADYIIDSKNFIGQVVFTNHGSITIKTVGYVFRKAFMDNDFIQLLTLDIFLKLPLVERLATVYPPHTKEQLDGFTKNQMPIEVGKRYAVINAIYKLKTLL